MEMEYIRDINFALSQNPSRERLIMILHNIEALYGYMQDIKKCSEKMQAIFDEAIDCYKNRELTEEQKEDLKRFREQKNYVRIEKNREYYYANLEYLLSLKLFPRRCGISGVRQIRQFLIDEKANNLREAIDLYEETLKKSQEKNL